MKRIEVMAKMDSQNAAEEIVDFLVEHNLVAVICRSLKEERLDAVYGLAQFLDEEVDGFKDDGWPGIKYIIKPEDC